MRRRALLFLAGYWLVMGHAVVAQVLDSAADRPRFLMASASGKPPADASDAPVLRRRVTAALDHVLLGDALQSIGKQAGVRFAVSSDMVPVDARVSLHVNDITLGAALYELLSGRGLDVQFSRDSRGAAIVRRGMVPSLARARRGSLVGKVTNAKTGAALYGIEVYLERTSWRTTTDSSGRYRLEADAGTYVLAARRLGYSKQSRAVTVVEARTDTVDLALTDVPTRLDEVVTTATGPKRRIELGNDITTLNADSIVKTAPISSVTDLLEHRVPGLTVQRTSGAPGDPARIRLRGIGSPLLNNDPLVVVDGIRMNYNQSSGRSVNLAQLGSGATQYSPSNPGQVVFLGNDTASSSLNSKSFATPSPLDYIDPNSIEKVEVLKGPSAATLFGQDAANGVIMITTKRGKAGPTEWYASFNYGQTRMEGSFPDMTIRWGHPLNRGVPNGQCILGDWENYSPPSGILVTTKCVADSIARFQLLNDPELTVLGGGNQREGTLTASGGSGPLRYSITGSYRGEQGLPELPAYEIDRFQARVGQAPPDWMMRPQQLTQWMTSVNATTRLGTTAELNFTSQLSRTIQQRSSLEQQLGTLMTVYLDKASGIYYYATPFGALTANGVTDSMLSNYFTRATDRATQLFNTATLNWTAASWFRVQARAGLDVQNRADQIYLPWGASIGRDSSGVLSTGQGTAMTTTLDLRGDVPEIRLFGGARGAKFRFSSGIGYTGGSIRDQSLQTYRLPEGTESLGDSIAGRAINSSDLGTFRWYAEPGIGFRDFWFTSQLQLHQAGTTDGGRTRGFFNNLKQQLKFPPTFNTSYILSDAPFFPFKDVFQSFRIRAAFGRSVRPPGLADRLRLYSATGTYWTDGKYNNGSYLSTLGNPDLRPERANELEGGFDASLLNYALSIIVTGYRDKTDDMIMSVSVPPSVSGGGSISANIGNTRKTGLEVTVTANLVRGGPVGWSATLGYSKSRNILVALAPGRDPFYSSGDENGGGIRVAPGYPLGGRWVKPVLAYADANGDGALTRDEIVYGDTAVFVGETTPNRSANLATTLTFFHNAVAVSANFGFDGGVSQVDSVLAKYRRFSTGLNDPSNTTLADQLKAIDPTSSTLIQTVSSYRLQDLSIAYQMPMSMAQRLGARSLSILLQGKNLGLWTNYSGLDPNVNAFSTGGDVRDTGILPQPRTWLLRVNVSY